MSEQEPMLDNQAVNDAEGMNGERDAVPGTEELLRQLENVRRRALDDVDKARKFAVDKFATELLAVKDSLEAALATGDDVSVASLKDGVELTLKQLVTAFERNSIKEVNPLGEKFDPNCHQAISVVDGDGEPNTVATVLQKGYLLNERVLRPALVMVIRDK